MYMYLIILTIKRYNTNSTDILKREIKRIVNISTNCHLNTCKKIERLQNQAMRYILKVDSKSCTQEMRSKFRALLTLFNRRQFLRSVHSLKLLITYTVLINNELIPSFQM